VSPQQDRHAQGFGVPGSGWHRHNCRLQCTISQQTGATCDLDLGANRASCVTAPLGCLGNAWFAGVETRDITECHYKHKHKHKHKHQHRTARPGYAFLPAPHILSVHHRFAAVPLTIAPHPEAFGVPRRGRITVASLSRLCPAARAANAIIAARLRLPRPPPAPAASTCITPLARVRLPVARTSWNTHYYPLPRTRAQSRSPSSPPPPRRRRRRHSCTPTRNSTLRLSAPQVRPRRS
jgi:hypothetical protein